MRTFKLLILSAVVAAPAYAQSRSSDFLAREGQVERYFAGREAIDSNLERSTVRLLEPQEVIKKRGAIQVIVMNAGSALFNFGPENVSARTLDGATVEIVPYEQLLKEEKNRQMWAAIATGLAAAGNSMNASQAGYQSGFGTYNSRTYGTYGSYSTSGTMTYSGYDAGAAQAAQSVANLENQRNFDRLAQNNAAGMAALDANIRTTSVDPGQSVGGQIIFELPKEVRKSKEPIDVEFTVDVGGEVHKFVTRLDRTK